jgi:hypothetical protein
MGVKQIPTVMKAKLGSILLLFLTLLNCAASAQKVKVGFDKTVDFSKYHSFSWFQSDTPPEMTLRRAAAMAEIESAMKSNGFTVVENGGDLILHAQGGLGAEIGGQHQEPTLPVPSSPSSSMSTVWSGSPVAAGSYELKGTLVLSFVDPVTKSVVWSGSASTKIDNRSSNEDFERVRKAIRKLLKEFPPRRT